MSTESTIQKLTAFSTTDLQIVTHHTIAGYEDGMGQGGTNTELATLYGQYVRWAMDAEAELNRSWMDRTKATQHLLEDMGYFHGKAQAIYKTAARRGYNMRVFCKKAGVE